MLSAEQARQRTVKVKQSNIEKLASSMEEKIESKILKALESNNECYYVEVPFNSNTSSYKEEVFNIIKSNLESSELGYKVSFIEGKPGDSREPLDYGTPDAIKVSWKERSRAKKAPNSVVIKEEVYSCDECNYACKAKVYTSDSFDDVRKITCKKLNKVVHSYLDWYDKAEVPAECPFNR